MAQSKPSPVWPVNENGEVVAATGTGTTNIVAFLSQDTIPTDVDGKFSIVGVGSGGGGSGVQTVSVTAPLQKTGTTANPIIGIPAATTSQIGTMSTAQVAALSAATLGLTTKVDTSTLGAASGVATLGSDGLLALAQRPPFVVPIATTAQLGGLKPDNTTFTVDPITGVGSVLGGGALAGSTVIAGAVSAAYTDQVGFRGPSPGITIPAITTRQTLTRFDLATNTQPAGATDQTADGPQFGTSSVRFIIGNGQTATLFPKNAVSYSTAAVDVTDKNICLLIKQIFVASSSIEKANVSNIAIKLHTEATPNTASTDYLRAFCGTIDRGDFMTGDWQNIRIPIEAFSPVGSIVGDSAAIAAFKQNIRYASISVTHTGQTADTLRFGLASITAEQRLATKGTVILSFDDCRLDTFTYAAPLMARYGFPGVLYPGNFRETLGKDAVNKMNITQLRALVRQGWQVASQAWSTESPGMSAQAFIGEMSELHNYMQALGLNGGADGSYFSNIGPGSTYQLSFEAAFRTMRNYTQFSESQTPRPETSPPSERQLLKCFGVFTSTNSATNSLIPYAQRAADGKGCAIYSWHALSGGDNKIGADGGVLTSFEKFLEWLDQNRSIIDVVTTDTWIRRMAAK